MSDYKWSAAEWSVKRYKKNQLFYRCKAENLFYWNKIITDNDLSFCCIYQIVTICSMII